MYTYRLDKLKKTLYYNEYIVSFYVDDRSLELKVMIYIIKLVKCISDTYLRNARICIIFPL